MGHRQAVRQRTLTPSLPGFESLCPSQKEREEHRSSLSFCVVLHDEEPPTAACGGKVLRSQLLGLNNTLAQIRVLNPCAPARKKKASQSACSLFSVIFACGEFYCFAVIFGLRRVIFASRVLEANIISLRPQGAISLLQSKNITLTKSAYH